MLKMAARLALPVAKQACGEYHLSEFVPGATKQHQT